VRAMNNNVGTALARIVLLTGGAIVGALLANWYDKMMYERAHQKSDYDKSRYSQGLAPHAPQSLIIEERQDGSI
jgi:hypothetical protein